MYLLKYILPTEHPPSLPTLGEDRYDGGGVGDDRVVSVVVHLAAVELVAAAEDGVGHPAGIAELGRQPTNLSPNHHNLVLQINGFLKIYILRENLRWEGGGVEEGKGYDGGQTVVIRQCLCLLCAT